MSTKTKFFFVVCFLLVSRFSFSQDYAKEFTDYHKKADSLYGARDYKNAAINFATAARLPGVNPTIHDWDPIAFCWSLAGYPDSAFYYLNIISALKDLTFSDVDILDDDDYIPIQSDKRWEVIKYKMFLNAYNTFLLMREEAGGKDIPPLPNNTSFVEALGATTDTAFFHLNDAAYFYLKRKEFNRAYNLFKVSIDNFLPSCILYQNMTDYYLATGDIGRAYIYFSRKEVVKYQQQSIISGSSLKIDSAIKAEYRDFSIKTGKEVLPPAYLISVVANTLLRNGMTDKAYPLFKMNLENYPSNYLLYKDMETFYTKKGADEKANDYNSMALILLYRLPKDFFQPSYNLKDYFTNYDKNVSANKDKIVFHSEGFFNSVANFFLANKMYDKAELLFKLYSEKYPESLNACMKMSTFYKTTHDKIKEEEFQNKVQFIKDAYSKRGISGTDILPDTTYNVKVSNPACLANCPTVLIQDNGKWKGGLQRPFADLLTNDGFNVELNRSALTKESLSQTKVVVIASDPLTKTEIQILNDWIHNGGSLLAMTHHDELHFDSYLNTIGVQTQEINVTLDSVHGVERDGISLSPAYIVFSEKDKLLGNHAILKGRDNSEKIHLVKTFGGGKSIIGPSGSSVLLRLSESAVDFMTIDPNPQEQHSRVEIKTKGLRSYGVAFTMGKGKIVVLSSSFILTAELVPPDWGKIGMNNPGSDNKQFALNIMRWLTGYLK